MTRPLALALPFFVFFPHPAFSQEKVTPPPNPLPVETMHKLDRAEKAIDAINDLELLVDRIAKQKFSDCMKAFGNQNFCQCLREKSPVGVDFAGYVKVVTTTKDELGYSKADKETKRLIDATLKAREVCVVQGK